MATGDITKTETIYIDLSLVLRSAYMFELKNVYTSSLVFS